MEFLDIYDESFYENNKDLSGLSITEKEILNLINERINAKKNKDYARADEIRNYLDSKGILLKDSPSGTEWSLKA